MRSNLGIASICIARNDDESIDEQTSYEDYAKQLLIDSDRSLAAISRESGLGSEWLKKFRDGSIKKPDFYKILSLLKYFNHNVILTITDKRTSDNEKQSQVFN